MEKWGYINMLQHEFSWSGYRYTLFYTCQRAYYFHYYGSWGGWNIEADNRTKKLYQLKSLKTSEEWVSEILKKSFQTTLGGGRFDIKKQKRKAFSIFRNELCDLRKKPQGVALRSIDIDDLYYQSSSFNTVAASAEKSLNKIFANLARSKVMEMLGGINYLDFKKFRTPAYFYNDGIKVWCSPDIIWEAKGVIYILNLFTGDPTTSEFWALKSGVDVIFAGKEWNRQKTEAVSIFPALPPPLLEVHITRNIMEIKSLIKTSSAEMLAITNLDREVYEESFAKFASSGKCQQCKYREICDESY